MSEDSSSDVKKSMEQPNNDLSEVLGQLSVATDGSDEASTPPKNLSDMPVDVVILIIERSGYKEQLKLRKVSKSFRALVDKRKPSCKRLEVLCKSDCIIYSCDGHRVAHVPTWLDDNQYELASDSGQHLSNIIIQNNDNVRVAFHALAFLLNHPKLQLDFFSFDSYCDFDDWENYKSFTFEDHISWTSFDKHEIMQKVLKSINHQLYVKEYSTNIYNLSNGESMLSYLKPGILEKIKIISDDHDIPFARLDIGMKRAALLDQWKQAKELELEYPFYACSKEFLTHFKRLQFNERFLDSYHLDRIEEFILEHENVEFCSLTFYHVDAKEFESIVGTPVSPNLSHYSPPDSEYYLEYKLFEKSVEIRKIKKS